MIVELERKVNLTGTGHKLTLSFNGGKDYFECASAENLAFEISMRVHSSMKRIFLSVKAKRWGYVGKPGIPISFERAEFKLMWDECQKSHLMWLRQDSMVSKIVTFAIKK